MWMYSETFYGSIKLIFIRMVQWMHTNLKPGVKKTLIQFIEFRCIPWSLWYGAVHTHQCWTWGEENPYSIYRVPLHSNKFIVSCSEYTNLEPGVRKTISQFFEFRCILRNLWYSAVNIHKSRTWDEENSYWMHRVPLYSKKFMVRCSEYTQISNMGWRKPLFSSSSSVAF